MAGISRIQTKSATMVNASSNSLTLTSSPTNTNGLVIVSGYQVETVVGSSITQTGATWNLISSQYDATNTLGIEVWVALNVSGAGTGITLNMSGTTRNAFIVCEYSNLASASILDKSNQTSQASSGTGPDTGLTATTTLGNEVWVAATMQGNGGVPGFTQAALTAANNGFGIVDQQGTTFGTSVQQWRNVGYTEKIVTSLGTAGCSFTTAGGVSRSTNIIVALRGLASDNSLPLLGVGA